VSVTTGRNVRCQRNLTGPEDWPESFPAALGGRLLKPRLAAIAAAVAVAAAGAFDEIEIPLG
jgi:hypothetical protein